MCMQLAVNQRASPIPLDLFPPLADVANPSMHALMPWSTSQVYNPGETLIIGGPGLAHVNDSM